MNSQEFVAEHRMTSSMSAKYTGMTPELQIIMSDGGPWVMHNVACAVCGDRTAVLDLTLGVFLPCWGCQKVGWKLELKKRRWWNVRRH